MDESPAGRGKDQSAGSAVLRQGEGLLARSRAASWATGFSLILLVLTLLALALVPGYLERNVARSQRNVREFLEPARELVIRIESSQARQIANLQALLLSGDARYRQRYRTAREEEEEALLALQALLDPMSLDLRARTAPAVTQVLSLSLSWHLGHSDLLSLELTPPDSAAPARPGGDLPDRLATEQAVFNELSSAAGALRAILADEIRQEQGGIERARALRLRATRLLAGAGLLAAFLVLGLGWRMRGLMRESETRRVETLRARREADALLRATGDGVLGMDRAGRCTFLNRAGVELLGYSTRLVEGRDVHELLHHSRPDGTPLPRETCPVVQALEKGEPFSGRAEVLWRAGREPFPVLLSLRPLKDGGEVKGGVMTFTDMTETREAEDSLRRAVRARDEVLAVVSHDLRNPVGTVVSAAGLLLELDLPAEKVDEHLRAMKRSGERMNRLIQDLLDVARLEAGGLAVRPSRVELLPLLDEVVGALTEEAAEKGVSLLREVDGVGEVVGDRDRLIQILTNLVENALKFTPRGGDVRVVVREDPDGRGTLFSVSDTGRGISLRDQERLFDRFWQVSRRDSGGAGLGLSIVKGLVEAHGGDVWVESVEGEGSTFWFTLPGRRGPGKRG